jgi:hypothetical protein
MDRMRFLSWEPWTVGVLSMLLAGCSGCGDGGGNPEVRISFFEVMAYDLDYVEDPWGEVGLPDFYVEVSVQEQPYATSEVVNNGTLPVRLAVQDLVFQGVELDQTVELRLFDQDDDSLDDFVGQVTFVPGDLLNDEPTRQSLYGGYLQLDLLLAW